MLRLTKYLAGRLQLELADEVELRIYGHVLTVRKVSLPPPTPAEVALSFGVPPDDVFAFYDPLELPVPVDTLPPLLRKSTGWIVSMTPEREMLFRRLSEGPCTSAELAMSLGMKQTAVARQLKRCCELKYVISTGTLYKLNPQIFNVKYS